MNEMVKQLIGKWNALPASRKSIIVIMSTAIILAGVFFGQWLTRVDYTPLFTDLDPKNASAVVEKLQQSNIPHRLAAEGTTILVPQDQVYDIRIQLAGEGLLTNTGLGFELFDKTKLGVTDFERRLDYQRALQEELRRTVVQLSEIEQARVHLVLPEKSVFISEDRPASAAVTIKLKPLAQLKPEQVKGIIYLVSSSVENLPPENVKVIDSSGRVLSEGALLEDGPWALTQQRLTQYELRRTFEKDLERRVQQMLERILGLDQAVAMVTAELNYDQVEETSVEYGESSVLSEQNSEEQSSSTGGAQGPAGVEGNVGIPTYQAGNQPEETYSKTENTTNYMVDQIERRIIQAPGQLRRLSTAVVVNGILSEEQTEQIRQIVEAAIGYDAVRGDQITVMNMAFDNRTDSEFPETAGPEPEGLKNPYWYWAALGGAVLLLLIIIILFALRKRKAEQVNIPLAFPKDEPISVNQIVPELTVEDKIRKEKQIKISEIVKERPEEAIQLIRTWLSEE